LVRQFEDLSLGACFGISGATGIQQGLFLPPCCPSVAGGADGVVLEAGQTFLPLHH